MTIAVPYFTIKTKSDPGELIFGRRSMANSQARLAGRYALAPDIDLAAFSCRAVIDWIVIFFWLGRTTQFQWLQDEIETALDVKCYVKALEEGPGKVTDKFDVRIQEPDLRRIRTLCDALGAKYGLEIEPVVRAIEISVDFTPREPDHVARAKLYTALTRHLWTDRDVISNPYDRPRFTWGKKTKTDEAKKTTWHTLRYHAHKPDPFNEHFLVSTEHDRAPFVDSNYYVGAKNADVRWRIMDKVIDRQNRTAGTFLQLDEADQRVRIEVTLDQPTIETLGVTLLEDLPKMLSSRLQKSFFTFMLPTFLDTGKMGPSLGAAINAFMDGQRMEKFRKAGVIGLKAMDDALERRRIQMRKDERRRFAMSKLKMKRLPRVGTQKTGTFLAFDELNGRVSDALGHLGERVAATFSR